MDPDNIKARVQRQFGATASAYATSDVHARGESLELLLKRIPARSDWRMLDVATGAGHTALAFAPVVESAIASDLTTEMLAKTRELAASLGLGNISTRKADAEDEVVFIATKR